MPAKKALAALASATLFFALFEIALRAVPAAIPLALLAEFNPEVRAAIAKRRGLQRAEQTIQLPRDDGGPLESMWLYKGGSDVHQPFDEPGIVPTMRMDARGFCNPEPNAYDVDRIDVAALGDSFTWCTNVEPRDAWPSVLARLTGLRVYNFGVPARGPYEYLELLKQYGLAKSPRFVVMAIYEGNDLRDAFRYHQAKGTLPPEQVPCPFGSASLCNAQRSVLFGLPGRHSYVVNLLATAAWYGAYAWKRNDIDFQYDVKLASGGSERFNSRNGDLNEVAFAQRLGDGSVGLWLFDDALEQFVELGRAHAFEPVVIYIPSAYSGYGDRAHFTDSSLDKVMRSYSLAQRRYFAEQSRRLGYRYLDTTPALRHAADQDATPLFFRTNVHPTQRGHEVVASEVANLLGSIGGVESANNGR